MRRKARPISIAEAGLFNPDEWRRSGTTDHGAEGATVATDLVIDADGHCSEPTDELTKWLAPEYVDRAPVSVRDGRGRTTTLIEGRPTSKRDGLGSGVSGPFSPKARTGSPAGMRDPIARLAD